MNTHQFINQIGYKQACIILDAAPEASTHFNYFESDEYNHYVIIKPEWSELNKHGYFEKDDSTGLQVVKFLSDEFGGHNLMPILIDLVELKQIITSIKIIRAMYGLDQAKVYVSLNDIRHNTVLRGERVSLDRIKEAIADCEPLDLFANENELL